MRIACPNCAAAYEVPDQALATGPRLLKCARCGHRFEAALPGAPPSSAAPEPPPPPPEPEPLPPPAAPAPPSEPTAEPPPAEEPDRPPPTRGPTQHSPIAPLPEAPKRDPRLLAAWVLSVALLVAAAWAAVHFRTEVVRAWPPATRLFAALGLH
ncbi:zinc-ribbon domain-containing protein [Falsiroseomonas sp. HW251]|uniref:zinc-ribbon domain-containing protein n=1 Tax=Falsiroseomonas sp. HW251 TaxID=3390998 RepID=UPI003D31FDF1